MGVVRAMAANEPNVCKWFVEYEKVLHDLKITSPVQILSSDQTDIQKVPKEEKVLCEKHKSAYQTIAADQVETSMVLTFVNGIGNVDLLTDTLSVDSSTTDQVSSVLTIN